jgi:pimeloyl-ACP methyl ester carboxylesterase
MKRAIQIILSLAVLLVLFVLLFPFFRRDLENMNGKMVAGDDAQFVQLEDKSWIHYVERGSGDRNLILIHGFCSSTFTWNDVIGPLSEHFHVYALDLPGFGFSDKPRDFDYDYENFAHAVRRFMDEKGIERATLAGNSMGGGVTAKFAALYPQRVDRVILVDSAGYPHEGKGAMPLKLLGAPLLGRFLFSLNSPGAMKIILQRTSFHDDAKVTDERARAYFDAFRVNGAGRAAKKTIVNIAASSLRDDIKKITAPTLIIWGENDELIPPEIAEDFHRDIKGSKLVVIPNCGHLPEEEKPEAFVAAVLEFMGVSNGAPVSMSPAK